MKKHLFFIVTLFALSKVVFADILPVTTQIGNVIMPAIEKVPVEMKKEIVNICDHQVECKFWMKNTLNKNVRMLVAFPGEIGGYELMINGTKTIASTHRAKFKKENKDTKYQILDSLPYLEFKTWYVEWKPKETILIEFNYAINGTSYRPGIVEVESLSYIVKTGALWKGPIGEANINVYLSGDHIKERLKHTKLVASPQNYELKNDTISWHFKNWEPTEDISVNFCRWLGLSFAYAYGIVGFEMPFKEYLDEYNHDLRLITQYLGDNRTYGEQLLDSLAETSFDICHRYYPEKSDEYRKADLKALWARILKDQILARHDSVEAVDEIRNVDIQASISPDGYRSRHSLFYKDKKNDVTALNDVEKRNIAFLNDYIVAPSELPTNACGDVAYFEKCLPEWEYNIQDPYGSRTNVYLYIPGQAKTYYYKYVPKEQQGIWLKSNNGKEKMVMGREDYRIEIIGYNYNTNNLYLWKTIGDTNIIIYKMAEHKIKDSLIVTTKENRYLHNSKYVQSENKIYLLGVGLVIIDLKTKKYDIIKIGDGSSKEGLAVYKNSVITKGYKCFYKADLNTKEISKTLSCESDLHSWYANEELGKMLYIEPWLNRVYVIDMETLENEGSFYVENPRHLYRFEENGTKAYILCYRKTENNYHAVAVVDLVEAMKHLKKTDFYRHF